MVGRIFHLNDQGEATPMKETDYDAESTLQELLAKHPDLLAGDQIDSEEPRRWLLVTREMAVASQDGDVERWSLDHLFLDQDAIPTLVEVKRSTNTDIRRKVVGQLLDYAANAVAYWPLEKIQAKFQERCAKTQEAPGDLLTAFLDDDREIDDFWQQVKANLQAGRIRLVFVADSIPLELRRIVEFLNTQMDPAEVLAIEIKQFVGDGMTTLVPRVLGQRETARPPGAKAGKPWDEPMFMEDVSVQKGDEARRVAEELLHWIAPQVTYVYWGTGATEGGIVPVITHGNAKFHVCRLSTRGWFIFRFDWLCNKPPFSDETARRQMLAKIHEIPGIHFADDVMTRRARIPFEHLTTPDALEKLKAAIAWLIKQIHAEFEGTAPEQS